MHGHHLILAIELNQNVAEAKFGDNNEAPIIDLINTVNSLKHVATNQLLLIKI